ncbi:MAG: DUF3467 domain-containing protein [Lentisphaeria bacterium]|nr:DUF3467 domain-containing protein [Lentisphaeria bacterium]
MSEEDKMSDSDKSVEEQAAQQTGQQTVRVRIDQRDMDSSYANSFRPIASTEEILLDFGINQAVPAQGDSKSTEIIFKVSSRVIMNYYTAKRLAISLSQVVGQYEEQFGEIKLNAADRRLESKD